MRRYFADAVAVVLLLAAAAGLLWPYLLGRAIPLDLSLGHTLAPWQQPGADVETGLAERHLYETYPAYLHMARVTERGGLLWNPADGLGAPFLAQWHTRGLSPFSLPVYLLGVQQGLAVAAMLKLAVAGLLAFYVARRFGLHSPLACVVGALYLASPAVYLWSSEPLGDVMPWLPLALLGAERLALGQRQAWPLLGLCTLLVALGGHPPALVGLALFVAVYVPLRAQGLSPAQRGLRLLPGLVGVAVGITAAAVQWWPYFEYLGQTGTTESGMQAVTGLSWRGLLLPAAAAENPQAAALLFPGMLPVLMLPLWWLLRPYMDPALRSRTGALLIVGIGGLLLALVTSLLMPQPWLAPWSDPSVFLLAPALALAFVAGAVAEEWLLLNAEQLREALPKVTTVVPVLWIVYLAAMGAVVIATGTGMVHLAAPVLVAVAAFVLFGYTLIRPAPRLLGYGLSVVACLASAGMLMPLKPASNAAEPLPPAPFAQALSSGHFSRIAGSGALASWPLSVLGMQQCFSPNTAGLERLERFQHAAAASPLLLRRTGAQGLLLTKRDIQEEMPDIRPMLQTKAVFEQGAILFEDKSMAARARVIYAGRHAEGPADMPGAAGDLPLLEGAMLPEDGTTEAGAVSITSEQPAEVRLRVENSPAGVVVLADQWYPGWTATVNNEPAAVLPVDAAFRGIEIGEGPQDIVLRYQPRSVWVGLIISAVSLVILVGALVRSYATS